MVSHKSETEAGEKGGKPFDTEPETVLFDHANNVSIDKEKRGGFVMSAFAATVEKHHQLIILALVGVILFFLVACTFNSTIPICHWLFGCDHLMHS
jgi:hypothetical protein